MLIRNLILESLRMEYCMDSVDLNSKVEIFLEDTFIKEECKVLDCIYILLKTGSLATLRTMLLALNLKGVLYKLTRKLSLILFTWKRNTKHR